MLNDDFWKRQVKSRLGRRRFLRSAAGAGLVRRRVPPRLLDLSARYTSAVNDGLLSRPLDTTSLAGRRHDEGVIPSDVPSFDPLALNSITTQTQIAAYTYPRLMKFAPAPGPPKGAVDGDLVETYEISPDRLLVTLRLRQGLKWEGKAPTNGRAIDAADVVFSWNKFARFSPFRGELALPATPRRAHPWNR